MVWEPSYFRIPEFFSSLLYPGLLPKANEQGLQRAEHVGPYWHEGWASQPQCPSESTFDSGLKERKKLCSMCCLKPGKSVYVWLSERCNTEELQRISIRSFGTDVQARQRSRDHNRRPRRFLASIKHSRSFLKYSDRDADFRASMHHVHFRARPTSMNTALLITDSVRLLEMVGRVCLQIPPINPRPEDTSNVPHQEELSCERYRLPSSHRYSLLRAIELKLFSKHFAGTGRAWVHTILKIRPTKFFYDEAVNY